MRSRPYIVIAGPTASGKTALAVDVAKRIGGEVVSADSMQIYADVSVGTARPDAEEMQGVAHHLLGFVPLGEKYSVARFCADADAAFSAIFARGATPVLCGGTGLYIQSFMENLSFLEQPSDEETRRRLQDEAREYGGAAMLERLRAVDPETASRLHENDLHRIVRALEVYAVSGVPISEQVRLSHQQPSPYSGCAFLLNFRDRATLYERIDRRVEGMLQNGLTEEARRVYDTARDATVWQAIGYKELLPYLRGECSRDQAVAALKAGTRHYAKRQLSWFHRMPQMRELFLEDYADTAALGAAVVAMFEQFCREDD